MNVQKLKDILADVLYDKADFERLPLLLGIAKMMIDNGIPPQTAKEIVPGHIYEKAKLIDSEIHGEDILRGGSAVAERLAHITNKAIIPSGYVQDTDVMRIIKAIAPPPVIHIPLNGENGLNFITIYKYGEQGIYTTRKNIVRDTIDITGILFTGWPENVNLINDPITKEMIYSLEWHSPGLPVLHLKGNPIEIYSRLKEAGVVINSNNGQGALNLILNYLLKNDNVNIISKPSNPGFYKADGNIIHVEPTRQESNISLPEALNGLDKIINLYDHNDERRAKVATVIKWFLFAPFGYVYKTAYKKRFKWLYLSGESFTGKSTIAHLALSLWGLNDATHEKSFSNINTQARIGEALRTGTYPIVIDETGDLWDKGHIVDIIKNSIDSPISRSIKEGGQYKDWPALAPMCFTSNDRPPEQASIDNRIIQILFTRSEIISNEAAKLFHIEDFYRPEIGPAIAHILIDMEAAGEWQGKTWRQIIEMALSKLYQQAGRPVPAWVLMDWNETIREHDDSDGAKVRHWQIKRYNDDYAHYVRGIITGNTPKEAMTLKIQALSDNAAEPFIYITRTHKIYINPASMLETMTEDLKSTLIKNKDNLRQLLQSQIPGAEYKAVNVRKNGIKTSERRIVADLSDYVDYLLEAVREDDKGSNTDFSPL